MTRPAAWIDTHLHTWDQVSLFRQWLSDNDTLPQQSPVPQIKEQAAAGVSGIILVEAGVMPEQARQEAAWMLNIAQSRDDILGVIAAADWSNPESVAIYGELPGTLGVRLNLGEITRSRSNIRLLAETLALAKEAELTVDILSSWKELDVLSSTLDSTSNGEIVLDHMGSPPVLQEWRSSDSEAWRAALARVGRYDRVSVKVSGLPALGGSIAEWRPFLLSVYEIFGSTSIVLGSDWPVSRNHDSYGKWVRSLLSADDAGGLDRARSANALRIYTENHGTI